jgi:hypothetical protein
MAAEMNKATAAANLVYLNCFSLSLRAAGMTSATEAAAQNHRHYSSI